MFVTPVDGETTALVPEPLYRELVETSAAQSSGVRILNSKLSCHQLVAQPLRTIMKFGI